MDPRSSFPLAAVSRQWSALPQGVSRLIKRFAQPATPSAQAFKDAFQEDAFLEGDYLTCRGEPVVMCSLRGPGCTNLPYRAFIGWHLGPNRTQTRYLGQRFCVPCCRRLGVDPRDRTLCIIDLGDSCEDLGWDEDASTRSDASSP